MGASGPNPVTSPSSATPVDPTTGPSQTQPNTIKPGVSGVKITEGDIRSVMEGGGHPNITTSSDGEYGIYHQQMEVGPYPIIRGPAVNIGSCKAMELCMVEASAKIAGLSHVASNSQALHDAERELDALIDRGGLIEPNANEQDTLLTGLNFINDTSRVFEVQFKDALSRVGLYRRVAAAISEGYHGNLLIDQAFARFEIDNTINTMTRERLDRAEKRLNGMLDRQNLADLNDKEARKRLSEAEKRFDEVSPLYPDDLMAVAAFKRAKDITVRLFHDDSDYDKAKEELNAAKDAADAAAEELKAARKVAKVAAREVNDAKEELDKTEVRKTKAQGVLDGTIWREIAKRLGLPRGTPDEKTINKAVNDATDELMEWPTCRDNPERRALIRMASKELKVVLLAMAQNGELAV